MFVETDRPFDTTGGRERDVMDEDVLAAGMHNAQMIANSKHR
jgi:hypothetical protein